MELDPKDLSALGGAGSALIAAVSYWAKTRHERRRATRTVLYYLLELHHAAYRFRAAMDSVKADLIPELRAALKLRGFELDEGEASAALKQAEPMLAEFGRMQLEGAIAESSEAFAKGLAELSREDPVLAFRLRGRDQLMLLPRKIESFVSQNAAKGSVSLEADQIGPSDFDDLLSKVALEELRMAIRETALRCDLITLIRVKWLLREAEKDESSGLKEIVRPIAEESVSALVRKRMPTSAAEVAH